MIFRNSLNSTIRAKGKTLLFCLLITLLTLLLCLGGGLWFASMELLQKSEETYSTIGVFEYKGPAYPDISVYDQGLLEASKALEADEILSDDNVLLWERTGFSMGSVENFERAQGEDPYEGAMIVVCRIASYPTEDFSYYTGIMEYALYGSDLTNASFYIDPATLESFIGVPEKNQRYIMTGIDAPADVTQILGAIDFYPGFFSNEAAEMSGFDIESIPPVLAIEDDYNIENTPYKDLANFLSIINNWTAIYATDDVLNMTEFHQGDIYISKGRSFNSKEIESGSKVCIISNVMADNLGIDLGNSINIAELKSRPQIPIFESWWVSDPLEYTSYEVVGIASSNIDTFCNIYIPSLSASNNDVKFGFPLGRAVLKNGSADEFKSKMEPLLKDRIELTVYDQGYSAAVQPLHMVANTSMFITIACSITAIIVLFVYGYLFVWRQKHILVLLLDLGTPKLKAFLWMLLGAGTVAVSASILGGALTMLLQNFIMESAFSTALSSFGSDLRYSDGAIGLKKDFNYSMDISPIFILILIMVMSLLILIICCCYCIKAANEISPGNRNKSKKSKSKINFAKANNSIKTSRSSASPLAFSFLSIKRGGLRTLVVPLVTSVMVLLISLLINTSGGWQKELNQLYDSTNIEGYFSSYSGKEFTSLSIKGSTLNELHRSNFIEDLQISYRMNYSVLETKPYSGKAEEYPVFKEVTIPSFNDFSFETYLSILSKQPEIAFSNDLSSTKEFFYGGNSDIVFLDGYDISFLEEGSHTDEEKAHQKYYVEAVVPQNLLEEHGAELGDIFHVMALRDTYNQYGGYKSIYTFHLRVVGYYPVLGPQNTIFSPFYALTGQSIDTLFSAIPEEVINPDEYAHIFLQRFNSGQFLIKDNRRLNEFKDWLASNGFSSVGGDRGSKQSTIIIRDQSFMESAVNLNRYISYADAAYPIIYTLVAVLGLIISYLMTVGRKEEFAVMRGLGVSSYRVFGSFFIEQALLCVAGCLLGLFIVNAVLNLSEAIALSIVIFSICYMLGSAIAVIMVGKSKAIDLLSSKD